MRRGLEARGLVLRRGGRAVLADVNLRVSPGEWVGLLGPNGAGKTTCMGVLTGRLRPDEGEVRLDGRCLSGLAPYQRARHGLGELTQEPSVFRGLKVRENIEAILELRSGFARAARRARADALLEMMGLASLRGAYASTLSGGERRRLELARVLAVPPRILLLDEPFAGIDPKTIAALAGQLRKLQETEGIGILLSDHHAQTVLAHCDRALLLLEGRKLVEGIPEDILASDVARQRYLGAGFAL